MKKFFSFCCAKSQLPQKRQQKRFFALSVLFIFSVFLGGVGLPVARYKLALFENVSDKVDEVKKNLDESGGVGDGTLMDTINDALGSDEEYLNDFLESSLEERLQNWKDEFPRVQRNWEEVRSSYAGQIDEKQALLELRLGVGLDVLTNRLSNPVLLERFGVASFFDYKEQLTVLYELTGGEDSLRKHFDASIVSALQERVVLAPIIPVDRYAGDKLNELQVKTSQVGTLFRLDENGFLIDRTLVAGEIQNVLSQRELDELGALGWNGPVREEMLATVNTFIATLKQDGGGVRKSVQSVSETELDSLREQGQNLSQEELADHNTSLIFFSVNEMPEGTCEVLYLLGLAESCMYSPMPALPQITSFSQGEDYTEFQGYIQQAPFGIDAEYAWNFRGGRGENIRIIDVEGGWEHAHRDFPNFFFQKGNTNDLGFRHHGTAVVGEVSAVANDYGVTGIAHKSPIGSISFMENGVGDAIALAISQSRKGDVLLIELQAEGPTVSEQCTCNCGQYQHIPMEYWNENYDLVKTAVSLGIIVVAPAGNGSMNLDDLRYKERFDPKKRDSGAIFVGAGSSYNHAPHCWTNYGARVDVHAWGDSVMTTGYGDLGSTSDATELYTNIFEGTSSAAPIVAGAATLLQSIYHEASDEYLNSLQMRALLASTGTPQKASEKNIGPQPNLRVAIASLPEEAIPEDGFNPDEVDSVAIDFENPQVVSVPKSVTSGNFLVYVIIGLVLVIIAIVVAIVIRRKNISRYV